MTLKFEVEKLEDVEEAQRGMYAKHESGKFRLQVEGVDDAKELKEALRKEREERAAAKAKLAEYEKGQTEAERKRLEEKQKFEELWKGEQASHAKTSTELKELRDKIAQKERNEAARAAVSSLTRDASRLDLLVEQALRFISHTPEGVKMNGPDGSAWEAKQLAAHLQEKYPFLVDGNQSQGGGAAGGKGGGAAGKKFSEYTGAELVEIRKNNPAEYDRLKKAHTGT